MKTKDTVLILAMLVLPLLSLAFVIPKGEGDRAYIYTNNRLYGEYDLSRDQIVRMINDNGIVNTIEIRDGRIRMKDATCPNRYCVKSGWISRNKESICCAPAGVIVYIGSEDGEYDAVTK